MNPPSLLRRAEDWNFDIDTYTNPYTPSSPLDRFPPWIARFLGYREEQEQDVGNVLGAFWSCIGAFCGLAVIAAVFNNTASIQYHHPPTLIASFGASAILEYNTIRSPLGQPRNALLGHTISALVGVSISKLFLFHPDFESIRWIAGAVSCGAASALMSLTGTVHPPGGASAVLAATSPEITAMGWYFVALVAWGATLMLAVGLIINNIQRQFPLYWWTPVDLSALRKSRKCADVEDNAYEKHDFRIVVSAVEVDVPVHVMLSKEEARLLEGLRERLRESEYEERVPSSRPSTCTVTQSREEKSGSGSEAGLCSERGEMGEWERSGNAICAAV